MKETVKTGEEIFEEIRKAVEERNEIGEAMDKLTDQLGYENTASKILEKFFKEADQKVNKLLGQTYKTSFANTNQFFKEVK